MPRMNEKLWQTDGNIVPTSVLIDDVVKEQLWLLKALLVGDAGTPGRMGLWTVLGSSDAVSAGMDGIDRWGSQFDAGKVVWAPLGTPHSWIVLQSPPALGLYLTLDCASTSGAVTELRMSFSKDAPVGGSVEAAPTWANGWNAYDTSTTGEHQAWTNRTGGTRFCNMILSDDGFWWFTISRSGVFETVLGLQSVETRPLDDWPYVSFFSYYASGGQGGPLGAAGRSPVSDNVNTADSSVSSRSMRGRAPDLARTQCEFLAIRFEGSGTSGADITNSYAADVSPLDGTYDEFPVFLAPRAKSGSFWQGGCKGRLIDAYKVGANAPEGSFALDTEGKIYASVVSDWWLPWTAPYPPLV